MKTSARKYRVGLCLWRAEIDASYGVLCNSDSTFTISGYTNSYGYGHQQRGDDSTNIFPMRINSPPAIHCGCERMVMDCRMKHTAAALRMMADILYPIHDQLYIPGIAQMMMIKTDSVGYTGCHEYTSHPEKQRHCCKDSSVVFSQSSGLVNGNISLIEMLVNTHDNDACLYTGMADEMNSKKLFIFPNRLTMNKRSEFNPQLN